MKNAIKLLREKRDNIKSKYINKTCLPEYDEAMNQIRELNTAIDVLSKNSIIDGITESDCCGRCDNINDYCIHHENYDND